MSDVPQVIREIAEKIGTTAEAAWPLYVQYVWAEGVTEIICGCALIAVLIWAIIRASAFIAKQRCDADDMLFGIAMCGLIAVLPIGLAGAMLMDGIPKALAPAGAAIHEVVGKVTK